MMELGIGGRGMHLIYRHTTNTSANKDASESQIDYPALEIRIE